MFISFNYNNNMPRKIIPAFFLSILLTVTLLVFYLFSYSPTTYSQNITLSDKKVVYELPYPGILPDHPLYPLKIVRDRILEFVNRDNLKKAQLYLLFSDKRVGMAQSLAKEGKDSLAITTLSKAEKYFEKIPPLLRVAKSQGAPALPEFVARVKLSNDKHREIIEDLYKSFPSGEQFQFAEILKLNTKIAQELKKF